MKFDTGFELQWFQKKRPNDPTLPYMTLRMTQRVPMSKVLKNTVTRKENNTVANPPHMGGQPTPVLYTHKKSDFCRHRSY